MGEMQMGQKMYAGCQRIKQETLLRLESVFCINKEKLILRLRGAENVLGMRCNLSLPIARAIAAKVQLFEKWRIGQTRILPRGRF